MKNHLAKTATLPSRLAGAPSEKNGHARRLLAALSALTLLGMLSPAAGQGTAFTYQGQLDSGGNPANGSYDLRFSLYNVATGGSSVTGFITNSATPVSNGLFTVVLDFGTGVFDGTTYWMQIGVRTNGGAGFIGLSPRQELTPAPYAIFAEGANAAGLSGTIPSASLAGGYSGVVNFTNPADSFAGNGSGLTNVNAATLGGLTASSFWKTTGNSATIPGVNFAGTIDSNSFQIHVNSTRVLRLEPDSRGLNAGNLIGGHPGNAVQQPGSGGDVIAGGGFGGGGNLIGTNSSGVFIGAGSLNKVGPNVNDSVIAGGYGNTNGAPDASIAGGMGNQIQSAAQFAHIGAGQGNIALGLASFIGGGSGNVAGQYSTIGGGQYNGAGGAWAAIGGGYNNQAENFSTVAGGSGNFAGGIIGSNCTVGGGQGNFAGTASSSTATVSGGYHNWAAGDGSFIGGGGSDGTSHGGNLAGGQASVIGGGMYNTNNGYASTIAGGFQNSANSTTGGFFSGGATVGGGEGNDASTDNATVSGGILNKATAFAATVPGGSLNIAAGTGSFAAGQSAQTTQNGTFIWGDGSQVFNGEPVDSGFNVLATGGVFFYDGTNGVHVDGLGNNNGTLDFGLKFGGALTTGEGIASKRNAGGNQYGLDFYTRSVNQMSLESGGALRINDNNLYLRTTADANHDGLAYRATVAGISFDGPFLWGYSGGALGTVVPSEVSLTWDYQGNVWVSNNCSVATLTIRGGADVAEPFEITAVDDQVPPGSVVVIDEEHPGHLKLSNAPYDTHVAGVVSGANGINPGIQMQQQGLLEGGKNVALTGRVYVQADASNGPIRPGDLLTTSRIPGHAMRVTNHAKGQGAILGKAMTGLSDGQGMVLVLVTLQ